MDEKTIELIVEQEDAGMRLDAYLREKTPFSRSRIVSLMEEGALIVDGVPEIKAARKTETGMKLMLTVPETKPVSIVPQNIPLEILYQDADVVLVNKPCGMVVHPAAPETKIKRLSMRSCIMSTIYRELAEKCARASFIVWIKIHPA